LCRLTGGSRSLGRDRDARAARTVRIVAAIAAGVWTCGCTVTLPMRTEQPVPARAYVLVDANPPATLSAPAGPLTTEVCQVHRVEGPLERVSGDTLVFGRIDRVSAARATGVARGATDCPAIEGSASVVRAEGFSIRERRFSWKRTTLLLVGVAAAFLAVGAYAASHMEYEGGVGSW
jgi:hypothetical protein